GHPVRHTLGAWRRTQAALFCSGAAATAPCLPRPANAGHPSSIAAILATARDRRDAATPVFTVNDRMVLQGDGEAGRRTGSFLESETGDRRWRGIQDVLGHPLLHPKLSPISSPPPRLPVNSSSRRT